MERERYESPASFLIPDYSQLECDNPKDEFIRQRYDILTNPVYTTENLNNPITELHIAKKMDTAERASDLVRSVVDGRDIQGLMGEYEFIPLRDVAEITTEIMWGNKHDFVDMPDPYIDNSNSIYAIYVKKLRELSANDGMSSEDKLQLLEIDISQAKTLEDISNIWLDYGGIKWKGKIYSALYLEYLTHYLMRQPDDVSAWDNLPDVPGLYQIVGLLAEKDHDQ